MHSQVNVSWIEHRSSYQSSKQRKGHLASRRFVEVHETLGIGPTMRYADIIIDEQVLVYKSQYEQDMQTS